MDIDPNYLADKRDMDVMIEAVKYIRQIVKEGYSKVGMEGMEETLPGEHVQTDEGIASFVRDNSETYYHPVGTCKVFPGWDKVLTGRWVGSLIPRRWFLLGWKFMEWRI